MNKKLALQGVVPPIATPLTDGDRVDEPSLRRLVRFLLGARIHGILANGTMGVSLSSLTRNKFTRSLLSSTRLMVLSP
jgi:dihydrodipicolinate synthase/N-acetylneuraminate lyase